MKFPNLEIENFLAITSAKLSLADRGLALIQGINTDDTSATSNGAGKSSLADAVNWVLYGETARGVTGDAVINESAGKGTRVSLTVDDDGETYVIARHRKHKPHKNALTVQHLKKDGTVVDLTKGTDKLTQEVVNKIIGASLEVFRAAVYAGQEQMPDLPAMTDKSLKILIEEAAGVTVLEEAYKEARKRLGDLTATRDQIQQSADKFAERVTWLENNLASTKGQQDAFEVNRQSRMDTLRTEVQMRVLEVKQHDVQIATFDEAAIQAAIAACDAKIASVQGEYQQLAQYQREENAAASALNQLDQQIRRHEIELESWKKSLAAVDHQVGCPCTECGRPLTEKELAATRSASQARVDTASATLTAAKKERAQALSLCEATIKTRRDFQTNMTDVAATNQQRAQEQAKLDQLKTIWAKRQQLATTAKAAGANYKQVEGEPNPYATQVTTTEQQIADTKKSQADLTGKLKDAQTSVEVAESVAKVFAPAGVRAHILDEVTPYLNQQTARYLSILSDGNIEATWTTLVKNAAGELREKFSIEVVNDKGAKSFAGLSGGEKRKVRVATALALQDLVATRASKPIDLFIGDEIDDALDPAGLERLMQILEEKANERGTVFVISHSDLRDWISQIVTVEKKNGSTTLLEHTN